MTDTINTYADPGSDPPSEWAQPAAVVPVADVSDVAPEVKRAIAAQVLTERADELAEMAERFKSENPLVGAAASVIVDHLRGYVKYRLPYDFEETR